MSLLDFKALIKFIYPEAKASGFFMHKKTIFNRN